MTHVVIFKTRQGDYTGFHCVGHAGSAEYGKDIVCASISVLVINTLNSIGEFTDERYQLRTNEDDGLIECKFEQKVNDKTELLLDSMVLGLKQIKSQYGKKYLDLKFKEV